MARIPEAGARIRPGPCMEMLDQACEAAEVAPGELLDWSIKQDGVSLILVDGRKVKIPIEQAEPEESPAGKKKPAGRAAAKKAE